MGAVINASVRLREGLHFTAVANSGRPIELDSPHEGNTDLAGPSPMETVLMALAGCSAMDVISILRKKRQPVAGLEVRAQGVRGDEYPKPYTEIELVYRCAGEVDPAALERAIELSRDRYCPVWRMLGATVDIRYRYEIVPSLDEAN